MLTLLETQPRKPKANNDADINHIYCECDKDTSLCGLDITDLDDWGEFSSDNDPDVCVVCKDLRDEPCPQCGD